MDSEQKITDRIGRLVARRNRELTIEAIGEGLLGILFSVLTFGFVYALTWMLGLLFSMYLHVSPERFAAVATVLFVVVSFISAWRNENPFARLAPLTSAQRFLTALSLASEAGLYSGRHALAGTAAMLQGGPLNLLRAVGTLRHRLPMGSGIHDEAAQLLSDCRNDLSLGRVRDFDACLLLRRLTLIRVVELSDGASISLTEKGRSLLEKSRPTA